MSGLVPASEVLLGLCVLVMICEIAMVVRRWPQILFLGVAALTFQPNWQTTQVATLQGTSVHGADVLVVLGWAACLPGWARLRQNLGTSALPAAVLTLMLSVSLLRGLPLHGQSAINQCRPTVVAASVVAFTLSLDNLRQWTKRLLDGFVWVALGLSALAVFHAVTRGVGSSSSMIFDSSSGQWVTGRVLIAAQAMAVAIGALIAMHRWAARQGRANLAIWLWLITVVVVCQHRSVWLATLAGAVLLLARARHATILRAATVGAVAALVCVALVSLGPGRGVANDISNSLSSVSDQRSTLVDRQDSWTSLVSQAIDEGPITIVAGEPFGEPWTRSVLGRTEDYSPHNWYVTIFLRMGLVGLCATIWLLLSMLRRGTSYVPRPLRLAVGFALIVYLLPYSLDLQETPILGLLLYSVPVPSAALSTRTSSRATASPRPPVRASGRELVGSTADSR